MVYLYGSRLFCLHGEPLKGARLLAQLARILSLGSYERFNSQLAQESMRQAVCGGNIAEAAEQWTKHNLARYVAEEKQSPTERYCEQYERGALTAAYYLAAIRDYDRAEKILIRLTKMLDRCGIKSRALVAHCNLLMLAEYRGNSASALSQLKILMSRFGLVCFSRTVFDETPGLSALLQYGVSRQELVLPKLFSNVYRDLFQLDLVELSPIVPRQLLTEKELEILALLAAGLSNAEISRQADIALSTTKWHLKNIYLKLGVVNRSAAIMLALKTRNANELSLSM